MAFKGNAFALLGGEDGDDAVNLLARVAASTIKAEKPPSAVEKRAGDSKTPVASSRLSSQLPSKPQRSSDHARSERGRYQKQSLERHNGNRPVERYHGQGNFSRQNYSQGSSFKRNYVHRNDEKPADGLKQYEGRANVYKKKVEKKEELTNGDEKKEEERKKEPSNGDGKKEEKKEELTDGDEWQKVTRKHNVRKQHKEEKKEELTGGDDEWQKVTLEHNVRKQYNTNGYQTRRRFGWKGQRDTSGSEVKDFKNKQREQNGVSGGIVEKLAEANVNKDEKEYIIRNRNFGGKNRVNRGIAGEGRDGEETRGNRGSYGGYRRANEAEGNENGQTSESTSDKEARKDGGDTYAASEGGEAVPAEASEESRFKKGRQNRVLSPEQAERLREREMEAKKMTLKEYEKKLEEKRNALKKVLESTKTAQARRVTLDKDFESMLFVGKKNKESFSIKLHDDASSNEKLENAEGDKLEKKVAMDKDDNKDHKPLVTNFKRAGRRGGRNWGREENENGGDSGHGDGIRNSPGNSRRVEEAAGLPPSFEDATHFPAL